MYKFWNRNKEFDFKSYVVRVFLIYAFRFPRKKSLKIMTGIVGLEGCKPSTYNIVEKMNKKFVFDLFSKICKKS